MEQNEQVLEIGTEELQELMSIPEDKLPPIVIDLEDFDAVEFQRGIHEASHLAGTITALLNCGVSESFVLDYLLNKESIKHNIEVAKINSDMNVEIAKNQKIVAEKNEL